MHVTCSIDATAVDINTNLKIAENKINKIQYISAPNATHTITVLH